MFETTESCLAASITATRSPKSNNSQFIETAPMVPVNELLLEEARPATPLFTPPLCHPVSAPAVICGM